MYNNLLFIDDFKIISNFLGVNFFEIHTVYIGSSMGIPKKDGINFSLTGEANYLWQYFCD